MNLNKIFKDTMDHLGVRGSDLAAASGRSRTNISEIRRGKANPPLNNFGELLDFAEELHKGFTLEFAKRIAIEAVGGGKVTFLCAKPRQIVENLSPEEKGDLLFAIAESLRNQRLDSKESHTIKEAALTAS